MRISRSLALAASLLVALASVAVAQSGSTGGVRPGISNPSRQPTPNGPAGSGSSFTPGGSASGMTLPQARAALSAQGFTDVQNLQRSGNIYTGIASRNGQTVPVTIDANTGQVSPQ